MLLPEGARAMESLHKPEQWMGLSYPIEVRGGTARRAELPQRGVALHGIRPFEPWVGWLFHAVP